MGLEFAAQTQIVGQLDRLVETARSDRDDFFDHAPGPDAVDPNPLVSLEYGLDHTLPMPTKAFTGRARLP